MSNEKEHISRQALCFHSISCYIIPLFQITDHRYSVALDYEGKQSLNMVHRISKVSFDRSMAQSNWPSLR